MSAPTIYDSAQAALEIEALRNRAEQAEDALAYWKERAEHLKQILHAVELLDCSSVAIENSGSESEPWEVVVSPVQGDDWAKYRSRKEYCGSTLLQALERLAKKEVAS